MGERADARGALPTWLLLAAVVAGSTILRGVLGHGVPGPYIFRDSLIYSELGKSLAGSGSLLVRDTASAGYGIVYPLTLAPWYALFDSVPTVFAAVKATQAFLMSLAAIPAYLIAREVVTRRLALLAAVFAVAVPAMAYSATVMTESVFYPLFLGWVWLLLGLLRRPASWGRTFAVVVGLVVLFLTRTQAATLVAVLLTAPLLASTGYGWRLRLLAFRPLILTLALGGAGILALQAARGRSVRGLLGAYEVVASGGDWDTLAALEAWAWHLETLVLSVAILPVIALALLLARLRRLDEPSRNLVAVVTTSSVWLSLSVALFASRFARDAVEERNLFYVAPLLFVALLVWLDHGAPRPWPLAAAATVLAATVPLLIPFSTVVSEKARADTLSLLPLWTINRALLGGSEVLTVGVVAAVLGACFLLARGRAQLRLLPVLVLAVVVSLSAGSWFGPRGVKAGGEGALFQAIRSVPRDWIDRAVPSDATVAVLWAPADPDDQRLWVVVNEFFNRSVGDVYFTDRPTAEDIAESAVTVGSDNVVQLEDGTPLEPGYILTDGAAEPEGRLVAHDPGLGSAVWRIEGPLVLGRSAVAGVNPEDRWSEGVVTWTRAGCRGGRLTVSLAGDAKLFPEGQTVTVAGRTVPVPPPPAVTTFQVPVEPVRGTCTARFAVEPTRVPAEVLAGSTDKRELGTHFLDLLYEVSE